MTGRGVALRGMDVWAARLAALTRRYGFILADMEAATAAAAAAAVAARQAPGAYQQGALLVEAAARAAGAAPAPLTSLTPPDPAHTIRSDVRRGWRWAERHQDTRIARAATAERVLRQSLLVAWRQGAGDQVTDNPEVVGYRRVADAGACAVCLALDTGEIADPSDTFDTHPGCGCGMEPVTSSSPPPAATGQDRFDAMSTAQQDTLFYGRGGAAMAALVRSGDVRLADIVHRFPRRPGQTAVVGQRPLASFR